MVTTPATHRRVITRKVVDWAAWGAPPSKRSPRPCLHDVPDHDGVFTDAGTAAWLSNGMTIAGLFIALLAPITGQRADDEAGSLARMVHGRSWSACRHVLRGTRRRSSALRRLLGIALLGRGNVLHRELPP